MNIAAGFQIEEPITLVPWGISENDLEKLLQERGLRRVTHGYYTIRCRSLEGLSHDLGFHFTPRSGGWLTEFELFQSSIQMNESYLRFQSHLEATFGQPTATSSGTEGFPTHLWQFQNVQISHSVRDRFGPEEILRIRRT